MLAASTDLAGAGCSLLLSPTLHRSLWSSLCACVLLWDSFCSETALPLAISDMRTHLAAPPVQQPQWNLTASARDAWCTSNPGFLGLDKASISG